MIQNQAIDSVSVMFHTTIASTIVAYSQSVAQQAVPWILPCVAVVLIDLIYGVRAAKWRVKQGLSNERVSFSSAVRRTGVKILIYACWIIMSVACGIAFHITWMTATLMGIILFIEFCSIMSNMLEPSGKTLNHNALIRWIARKTGTETDEDIIINIEKDGTSKENS